MIQPWQNGHAMVASGYASPHLGWFLTGFMTLVWLAPQQVRIMHEVAIIL